MKNKCATACNFVRANQFTSKDARPYRSFEIAAGPRLYLVHVVSRTDRRICIRIFNRRTILVRLESRRTILVR